MILVLGGLASGKQAFACELGFADDDMSYDAFDEAAVLCGAQDLVRLESVDIDALVERVAASKQVVLCQEVGSGIVPIDPGERAWRERVGELTKKLAQHADVVVRMVCGLPQLLKGSLPGEGAGCGMGAEARDARLAVDASDSSGASDPAAGASELSGAGHPVASSSFFSNTACKYFPCHEGVDERDFNCLFCYCPLYALGPACGGNFVYTSKGRKNCVNCTLPHIREDGVKLVRDHYEQLAALAENRA